MGTQAHDRGPARGRSLVQPPRGPGRRPAVPETHRGGASSLSFLCPFVLLTEAHSIHPQREGPRSGLGCWRPVGHAGPLAPYVCTDTHLAWAGALHSNAHGAQTLAAASGRTDEEMEVEEGVGVNPRAPSSRVAKPPPGT